MAQTDGIMSQDIYTVPDTVVFRTIAGDGDCETVTLTRTLLIQNKTSNEVRAILSQPATAAFKVSLPAGSDGIEEIAPAHLCLTIKAKSAFKARTSVFAVATWKSPLTHNMHVHSRLAWPA